MLQFILPLVAGVAGRQVGISGAEAEASEKLDLIKQLANLTPEQAQAVDALKKQPIEEVRAVKTAKKKVGRYSYSRNKKEIEAWLENVTSLKFEVQKSGTCQKYHLKLQLLGLTGKDSAFLTVDGDALHIIVYKEGDRFAPIETWKFTK